MSPASQMEMFGTKVERNLQAENAWLRERLEHAKEEFRKLRTERDNWKNGHDAVAGLYDKACAERAALQRKVSGLQSVCDVYKMLLDSYQTPATRGAPQPSRTDLTHLLTLAHPDKWSQGQPATALAHEISVALNALRDRLEVQP